MIEEVRYGSESKNGSLDHSEGGEPLDLSMFLVLVTSFYDLGHPHSQ